MGPIQLNRTRRFWQWSSNTTDVFIDKLCCDGCNQENFDDHVQDFDFNEVDLYEEMQQERSKNQLRRSTSTDIFSRSMEKQGKAMFERELGEQSRASALTTSPSPSAGTATTVSMRTKSADAEDCSTIVGSDCSTEIVSHLYPSLRPLPTRRTLHPTSSGCNNSSDNMDDLIHQDHRSRHNPDSYRYLLRMRPVNHQDRRIGHNPDSYQHFLRMRPGTDALDSRDAGMENSRTDESRDQTESLPQLHLPRLNHSEDLSC